MLGELAEERGAGAVDGGGGGAHDHELRIGGLAQDRGADVVALDEPCGRGLAGVRAHERAQGPLGLRTDGRVERWRDDVQHGELGVEGRAQRGGEAQRQLGVRPAADRRHDAPHLADAALLDDRDVAGPFAHDLVDGRAEDGLGRRHRTRPRWPAGVGPPQPKRMRSASSSAASSTMPSAARRPMRTTVRRSTPSGANSSTRCSRRRAWRARVAPSESGTPSGTSTMESAVSVPPSRRSAAPMRTRSAAVRGLASGMRMRPGSGRSRSLDAGRPASAPTKLGLGQLEGARLALHEGLGLVRRQLPRLDDQAGDPPEVDRHQRGDERARPPRRPSRTAMARS